MERRRASNRSYSPEQKAKRAEAQRRRAAADPDRTRRYHMARFNITPERYDEMLAGQGGVCAICAQPPGSRRLHVDHDHSCCPGDKSCGQCVRGLLCFLCNTGIGKFRDNSDTVAAAAAYLARLPLGALPLPADTTRRSPRWLG